jgi:hypothetical protein
VRHDLVLHLEGTREGGNLTNRREFFRGGKPVSYRSGRFWLTWSAAWLEAQ